MNKATIIGNLTRDPELRTVGSGVSVCDFTVAVNRRKGGQAGQPEADFFRVTAWRQLAEVCGKYLSKGSKVCAVGAVSCRTYQTNNGETRATLELVADDIEFLTARGDAADTGIQQKPSKPDGFQQVDAEELPF